MIIGSSDVTMAAKRSYSAREQKAQITLLPGQLGASSTSQRLAASGYASVESLRSGACSGLHGAGRSAVGADDASGAKDFRQTLWEEADESSAKGVKQTKSGRAATSDDIRGGGYALRKYGGMSVYDRVNGVDKERQIERIRRQSILYYLARMQELFRMRQGRGIQGDGVIYGGAGTIPAFGSENMRWAGSTYQYDSYEEKEQTDYGAKGKVVTADGREIDFNVSVSMSRSFEEYWESRQDYYVETEPVSLTDPLVINLDGGVASVSDQKILFDIDADGEMDSISRLGSGSGYLALDQNGDGVINDGSELFGTKSGDGFADLAAYDVDGNGWIDEADPIYEKLRIWVTDESGRQTLYRLKDKGVGAICLQNVSTDFDLKSAKDNATNARIRKSGVFLYENGMAGTVQHLDVAKGAKTGQVA